MKATIKCECVCCGKKRDVPIDSIPANDVPYCDECHMPMATLGQVKITASKKARK